MSLNSFHRFKFHSTVVTIERDHYYWNTTLASFTICPVKNRIDEELFDEYCERKGIADVAKDDFYDFIESLANATYESFHQIPQYDSVDNLNIQPEDYMMLIYNLTRDELRDGAQSVFAKVNTMYIRSEQVLTENGICYVANNYLAPNLSAMYLLTGAHPQPLETTALYQDPSRDFDYTDAIGGNFFDNDKTYLMSGFTDDVMIYVHSAYESINIAKRKYYAKNSYTFITSAIETVADEKLQRETTVTQRQCRFNSESNLTHFSIYTQGLCLQECRLNHIYKVCGCIPHFYPNRITKPKPVCSWQILQNCVSPLTVELLKMSTMENGQSNIGCNCVQNCVGSEVFVQKIDLMEDTNELLGSVGGVNIMRECPLLRYKRKILFSLTDLYVSIGASASFFTGFCVLGIIEIFYFFTVRLFWHIMGRKIEPQMPGINTQIAKRN